MQMNPQISPEQNLAALGYTLPPPPAPGGNYVSSKQAGSIAYLSGVISTGPDGIIIGTAGLDRSIEDGYAAARACAPKQIPSTGTPASSSCRSHASSAAIQALSGSLSYTEKVAPSKMT